MIYAMNELIKRQCEKLLPDIIIVHISDPMIEYNEDITNGFGVRPYMVSKAMIPDYFICGIPYGYGYNENINAISEGMAGRFDYGIDYVHLSNAEFDLSALSNNDITLVTYTSFDAVKRQIDNYCMDSNICVCNMLINDELMNVTGILAEKVNKHKPLYRSYRQLYRKTKTGGSYIMSKSEVVSTVQKLLSNRFSVPEKALTSDKFTEPLIGDTYRMDAINLTYFYFEMQKEFNIQFCHEDLLDYRFLSVDYITSLIDRKLHDAK